MQATRADKRNRRRDLPHPSQAKDPDTESNEPEQMDTGKVVPHERLKALECFHAISEMVEKNDSSLPDILQGIVTVLPQVWHYPELCYARLRLNECVYASKAFRQCGRNQTAPIRVRGQVVGEIEVHCRRDNSQSDEGVFLPGDRRLLGIVAERLGEIIERHQLREENERTAEALREANAGMRAVLSQIEEQKAEIHRSVMANVENVILPILRTLGRQLASHHKPHVALLEKYLGELTCPFVREVSRACATLAPAEIEVCNMIRNGLSTKEIAALRHVSVATIFKQRENIRRKLAIHGTNTNLTAYLMAMSGTR